MPATKQIEADHRLFNRLPSEFSWSEAVRAAYKLGFSRSWAWEQLEKARFSGSIKRVERGTYKKKLRELNNA